jgi:hypothetical protein
MFCRILGSDRESSKRDFGFCWGSDIPDGVEVVEELRIFRSEVLMKNPICAASYEWAVKLKAAGCPIDYLDALPRHSFRAEQLRGYVTSRVYALGRLETRYVIALRLGTDRPSGTIIKDWRLELPWQDHVIDWDCEPADIIPKKDQDEYRSLVNSRLMKVLNEGRLIRRGSPVDGVLCGRSFQPIGESSHGIIPAKLIFTDLGNTVRLCIDLDLYRLSDSSANRLPGEGAGQRVCRHLVDSGRRSVFKRQIEALIADEQAGPGADAIGVGCALETNKSEWGGRAIPAGPGSESGSLRGDAATRQGS